MRQHGALLGGEQSGHLIFREYSTTGDGLLAALQILRIMRERGKPLSELAGQLQLFPQQLINVHVERKIPFAECQPVADAVAAIETELGDRGRVLLRYSGTESVCRVMVEGEHPEQVARLAEMLAETVQKHLR
jgi:phosphoglucosamine mutase